MSGPGRRVAQRKRRNQGAGVAAVVRNGGCRRVDPNGDTFPIRDGQPIDKDPKAVQILPDQPADIVQRADLPTSLDGSGRVRVQQHDLHQRPAVEGVPHRGEEGVPQTVFEKLDPGGEDTDDVLARRYPPDEPVVVEVVEDAFRRGFEPVTRAMCQPVTDLGFLRTFMIIE